MEKLAETQIRDRLQTLPGWVLEKNKVARRYQFKSFPEAIAFVNAVATLAEERDHHPEIDIRYNQVVLGLWTHDAEGITNRDLSFAAALAAISTGQSDAST